MTKRRARSGRGRRIATIGLFAAGAAAIGWFVLHEPSFFGSAWRLSRVRAAYARGDWEESAKGAREALKDDPKNQDALVLLARSLARSGRDDRALEIYQRLGPSALEAQDYLLIGDAGSRLGQGTLSISAWLKAEQLEPDDPQTLARLARHYYEGGQLLEALSKARKFAPDPVLGLRSAWIQARIFSDLDQPESAPDLLDRVLAADDSTIRGMGVKRADAISLAARVNLSLGRPERALEILKHAPAAEAPPDARWLISRALLQQGRTSESASALEGVAPRPPLAREPAPYTGAVSCRPCHGSNYGSEQSSRHALTYRDEWDGPTSSGGGGEIIDPAWARVHHRLNREDGKTTLETTVADRTYRSIVEFVVGSGNHGETLMVKDENGEFRESRVSYQPHSGKWSKTINHPDAPTDALEYLGRRVSMDGVRSCVHCHTTTASAELNPSAIRPRDRGIGCERCHGPGGHHLKAVELGFSDLAIATPSIASAEEVTMLCAECHREPSPGAFAGMPSFIRFQAPTFMKSRCYVESGSFSCVTCHNPHKDAETSPAAYEAVCLQCHSAAKSIAPEPAPTIEEGARACPVDQAKGCLNCHMPKVPNAVPNAEFTDHHIRVRKDAREAGSQAARRGAP